MELLRQHGLYGGGLMEVNSSLLTARYNQCLADIGEAPTALSHFQIDGRGWSPEIAKEKQNPAYLSHGGAVQYAILLTPDQKGKPIYMPYFSFERAVMAYLFDEAGDAIARVTRNTGLWVQIDPGLSELNKISDIAIIKQVAVTLGDSEGRIQEAERQCEMVTQFTSQPDAWTNETLRQKLVASGQKFGDLRFAPTFKSSYQYENTVCFYTSQFGGVFVLRNPPEAKSLLVVCDEDLIKEGESVCKASSLQKKSLLPKLLSMGLVEIPVDWYRQNLKTLEKLREEMLVAVLDSKTNFTQLTEAQRQRCVMENRKKLPPEYSALERLEQRLSQGEQVDAQHLPLKLRWILARPKEGLPVYVANTIWRLICRVASVGLVTRFAYDKQAFFDDFGSWSENRKCWAVATIISGGLAPRRHV